MLLAVDNLQFEYKQPLNEASNVFNQADTGVLVRLKGKINGVDDNAGGGGCSKLSRKFIWYNFFCSHSCSALSVLQGSAVYSILGVLQGSAV